MSHLKSFIGLCVVVSVAYSCTIKDDFLSPDSFLSADQLSDPSIEKASSSIRTLDNGLVVRPFGDSLYLLEDDMLFNEEGLSRLSKMNVGIPTRGEITNNFTKYWPNGRVPYQFHSNLSMAARDSVLSAMSLISSSVAVNFVSATSSDINRVLICPGSGNASNVGLQQQVQYIILADYSVGRIMHELLHTLGVYHEHNRQDRNQYISVKYNNIKPSYLFDFQIKTDGMDIGSFDFNSVMLYSSYTNNPSVVYNTSLPMMLKIDGSSFYGQRDSLSSGDISSLRNIYGPPFHEMTVTREVLENYYENATEVYSEEMTVTISFYSDSSHSSLYTLESPIPVVFQVNTTTCTSDHQLNTITTYPVITIPAGVSSYIVCSRINRFRDEWGMPYDYDWVDYYLQY